MKKIFFFLLLAGGLASCKTGHTEFKKQFVANCEQSAKAQISDNRLLPLVHDYCECSAEELLDHMSDEELLNIKDANADPVLRAKLLRITETCMKEMQAEILKLK